MGEPNKKGHDMKGLKLWVMLVVCFCYACNGNTGNLETKEEADAQMMEDVAPSYVQRVDTLGLIILYPQYESMDLVCGTVPSKKDARVILFAEAAYTGELLEEFKHSNVAGGDFQVLLSKLCQRDGDCCTEWWCCLCARDDDTQGENGGHRTKGWQHESVQGFVQSRWKTMYRGIRFQDCFW